jgi:hypothetical protein
MNHAAQFDRVIGPAQRFDLVMAPGMELHLWQDQPRRIKKMPVFALSIRRPMIDVEREKFQRVIGQLCSQI